MPRSVCGFGTEAAYEAPLHRQLARDLLVSPKVDVAAKVDTQKVDRSEAKMQRFAALLTPKVDRANVVPAKKAELALNSAVCPKPRRLGTACAFARDARWPSSAGGRRPKPFAPIERRYERRC